ncbi:MAG: molybdenum cofactor guanylyltransferase [Pirellulales bacterium]|nr:molybdenum cofactor guanylyltransferase [Pirellulales bacterium]
MIDTCGGVVLCGGQSKRMGRDKGSLPFGDESLLQRVVRQLHGVVAPIVVVGSSDATLPAFAMDVEVASDQRPGRGPLEGLRIGLAALASRASFAFVVGCDYPFVLPAFIARMKSLAVGHDAAVVRFAERLHPLAGVYRTALSARADELLTVGKPRLLDLIAASHVRLVGPDELLDADPQLLSLQNVNSPADYAAALAAAGFPLGESPPAAGLL